MEIKDKLTIGAIGLLTILSMVLGTNLIGQENVYVCESRGLAMICDSLSKVNAEGIQTRCYFGDTYKICKEGWKKFEHQELNPKNYGEKYLCDQIECKVINNKVTSESNKQVKMEI